MSLKRKKIKQQYLYLPLMKIWGLYEKGDTRYKEDIADISKHYVVTICEAEVVKNLFNKLNTLTAYLDFTDYTSYDEVVSVKLEIDEIINALCNMLKLKGSIGYSEFETMYIDELSKEKTYGKHFINFLHDNKDYGIVPTCCEFKGDYGILRCLFENENCTPEKVHKLNLI